MEQDNSAKLDATPAATSKVYASRAEWLKNRRHGIGSSDAAAIMGLSPWGSALSVFVDKLGLEESPDVVPEYMKWGHILEDPIAKEYTARTGRKLHNPGAFTIYQNRNLPFLQVTPDRLILTDPDDVAVNAGDFGSLSIKTGGIFKAKEWDDEPPIQYDVQFQHELLTLGLKWGSFAVLIGGQRLQIMDVERNDTFCDILAGAEAEFWDRVLREDPPAADDSESAAKALQKLFPKSTGASIALPANPYFELADDLDIAKARKGAMEATIRGIENKIKRRIGEAEMGILPDGSAFTWKEQKRAGFKVEPTAYRVLRRKKR